MSETFEKISKVLDEDEGVPRAGGDSDEIIDELKMMADMCDDNDDPEDQAMYMRWLVRIRRGDESVTRLQAENAALQQRLNVADQRVDDLQSERDALKAEVKRLKNIDHRQILAESAAAYLLNSGAENFIGDVFTIDAGDETTKFEVVVTTQKVGAKSPGEVCSELQSELTKARELIGRVYDSDLAARHHQPYNVSKVIDDIESFLAHQSAPADTSADWEDTFGPDYEVNENDLVGSIQEPDNLLPIRDGYCRCGRLVHRSQINQSALAAKPSLQSDEIHQMAFEEGQPAENGDGYLFTAEEFDLFVERLLTSQSAPAATCETCGGTKVVDDGELLCSSGGIPFENGPIKCVKDCPDCAPAAKGEDGE